MATDFFQVETVFLRRMYVLFLVPMNLEENADGLKFLIRDWDTKFIAASDAVFTAVGVRIIKTPIRVRTRSPKKVDRQRPPRMPGPDADHRRTYMYRVTSPSAFVTVVTFPAPSRS